MKPKPKSMRHVQAKTFVSAMPRTGSSVYLTLSQMAREWERLKAEELELLTKLEDKQRRLAKLEAQMQNLKEQVGCVKEPDQTRQLNRVQFTEANSAINWQSIVVEY
jgi:chromosome segregation ATPase